MFIDPFSRFDMYAINKSMQGPFVNPKGEPFGSTFGQDLISVVPTSSQKLYIVQDNKMICKEQPMKESQIWSKVRLVNANYFQFLSLFEFMDGAIELNFLMNSLFSHSSR